MYPRGSWHARRSATRLLVGAIAGLALTLGVLPALTGALPGTRAAVARADDLTASLGAMRTGWDPNEPNLLPATVANFSSAPTFSESVTGQVYAQPLVIDSLNMVIVATEDDWVYGYTATGPTAGTQVFATQLGTPFNIAGSSNPCGDLTPHIGVTGTPAYDPSNGYVYMFANIVTAGTPQYYLIAINPASTPTPGAVVQQTLISGHPTNSTLVTFSGTQQMERTGVLVTSDGAVWGTFGSHCDHKPYTGYVVRVQEKSATVPTPTFSLWTDESVVAYQQAGIWQGGGGLVQDPQGRIFVTSGNGVSPTYTQTPPGQLAESVIRLGYNSGTNDISAVHFFSPANAPSLDAADTDFGSGGPVALPFGTSGTTSYPSLLAAPSKDGRVWLLNRGRLGGRTSNDSGALFHIQTGGGDWGHPAVFADTATLTPGTAGPANNFLFYVGRNTHLRAYKFGVASSGKPTLSGIANSSLSFGYSSGSPVVTSNGTDATSAVIWEVYAPSGSGTGSYLTAYKLGSAASTGGKATGCTSSAPCTLPQIWHSQTFTSAKFSIPATSRGWVYVGTRDGHLLGFKSPTATAAAVGPAVGFAPTPVGSTSSQDVTITATSPVSITSVTASTNGSNAPSPGSQFTVGTVTGNGSPTPVNFPVSLARGDTLTAHVTFAPAAPGGVDGTVSFATTSSTDPSVDVAVAGNGSQPGLTADASQLQFVGSVDQGIIPVAVGISVPLPANFTNYGTTAETVTSVTPPSGPFHATGLPTVGTKIRPGQTITVPVSFAPTAGGAASGTLTIGASGGPPASVQLSGTGAPAVSQYQAVNPVVNFGTVKVGKKATAYVYITNTGNTASTVQGTSAVPAPFATALAPPPGMPFNADSDMAIPVTFKPAKKGSFSTKYTVSWNDVNGNHQLTVRLTGTAV